MKKTSLALSLAALLAAGTAIAQTPAPSGPAAPGAPAAPSTSPAQAKPADPSDAKFLAADKDKSGSLEGAELDTYKADMTKIDTNKDGKVSKEEFMAATKAGVIK